MRKIKIAQIGINRHSHAKPIYDTITRRSDLFDFAGLALVENEREELAFALPGYGSFVERTLEEILQDPTIEAVAVETDEIHLTKYAQMAAEHGKHIHMEKPGGRELADFEKLIAAVKENKTIFGGRLAQYRYYDMDAVIASALEEAERELA